MNETQQILTDALRLFDGGRAWGQGDYPENCYCPTRALAEVCCDKPSDNPEVAARWILEDVVGTWWLVQWNDHPDRTFADVENAFKRAIEVAE